MSIDQIILIVLAFLATVFGGISAYCDLRDRWEKPVEAQNNLLPQKQRLWLRYVAPVFFLLLTWGAVAFDYYDRRHSVSVTAEMPNEELADTVQKWLDDFHLRYQVEDREAAYFSFIIQSNDGARIGITRLSKEHQQFITLFCHVFLEPESMAKMKSFPVSTQQWFYDQVAIELLRQNVVVTGNLLTGMQLEARVPISELTQGRLMDRLDELYSALTLVRVKLRSP